MKATLRDHGDGGYYALKMMRHVILVGYFWWNVRILNHLLCYQCICWTFNISFILLMCFRGKWPYLAPQGDGPYSGRCHVCAQKTQGFSRGCVRRLVTESMLLSWDTTSIHSLSVRCHELVVFLARDRERQWSRGGGSTYDLEHYCSGSHGQSRIQTTSSAPSQSCLVRFQLKPHSSIHILSHNCLG